jgi:hypothetical protein
MLPFYFLRDCAKLCNLSYLDKKCINENFCNRPFNCTEDNNVFYKCNEPVFIHSEDDCQLYTCNYNKSLVVWFRGTESLKDVLIDLNFFRTKLKLKNNDDDVLIHQGFYNQFESIFVPLNKTVNDYILDYSNKDKHLIFVGHSLGGALATIGACYFSHVYPTLKVSCVTFGSPRVGNNHFVNAFNNSVTESYRFVNDNDPVPCLPSRLRYKHVKGCQWLYQDTLLNETKGMRFYRCIKNSFLSLFGFGYNAFNDHNCETYINDLNDIVNKN